LLEQIIPEFHLEKKMLNKIAPAGWVMGYNMAYTGPEYMENAYPEEWRKIYERANYWFIDPVANWSGSGEGFIRWSDIKYPPDRQKFMNHARVFGLKYGASFATHNAGCRSFLTLSHNQREFTDQEISMMNTKFLSWVAAVTRPIELTEPEIAVLRLFRSGLSRSQVAEAFEVSEATVKRRMHDANIKMGCKTTLQAVAYATARKLI